MRVSNSCSVGKKSPNSSHQGRNKISTEFVCWCFHHAMLRCNTAHSPLHYCVQTCTKLGFESGTHLQLHSTVGGDKQKVTRGCSLGILAIQCWSVHIILIIFKISVFQKCRNHFPLQAKLTLNTLALLNHTLPFWIVKKFLLLHSKTQPSDRTRTESHTYHQSS